MGCRAILRGCRGQSLSPWVSGFLGDAGVASRFFLCNFSLSTLGIRKIPGLFSDGFRYLNCIYPRARPHSKQLWRTSPRLIPLVTTRVTLFLALFFHRKKKNYECVLIWKFNALFQVNVVLSACCRAHPFPIKRSACRKIELSTNSIMSS